MGSKAMLNLAWETLYMGAFVFIVSYWLHKWAFEKGLADEGDFVTTKKLKKAAKERGEKYKTGHAILDKWLAFGGGYYGIVALIKLIFIELTQFWQFITDADAIHEFFSTLGLGTLIQFLVEQIKNFVAAIIWPVDYIDRWSVLQIAIFIAITWGIYNYARKFARLKLNQVTTE